MFNNSHSTTLTKTKSCANCKYACSLKNISHPNNNQINIVLPSLQLSYQYQYQYQSNTSFTPTNTTSSLNNIQKFLSKESKLSTIYSKHYKETVNTLRKDDTITTDTYCNLSDDTIKDGILFQPKQSTIRSYYNNIHPSKLINNSTTNTRNLRNIDNNNHQQYSFNTDNSNNTDMNSIDENNSNDSTTTPKAAFVPFFPKLHSVRLLTTPTITLETLLSKNEGNFIFEYLTISDSLKLICTNKFIYKHHYKLNYMIKLLYLLYSKRKCKEFHKKHIWLKIYLKSSLSKEPSIQVNSIYTKQLVRISSDKIKRNIKIDVPRTFPQDKHIMNNIHSKMSNILHAYSTYNNKLKYVQGMNFITYITLSIYEKEINAFVFLDGFINQFHFEDIMNEDGMYIKMIIREIESFLFECKTLSHFKMNNIQLDYFVMSWILTLFSNYIKDKELVVVLWDFIFVFGYKFFYCFIFAIFDYFKDDVCKLHIDIVRDKVKQFGKKDLFEKEFISLMKSAIDLYVNKILKIKN